jgi:hypothetical protein
MKLGSAARALLSLLFASSAAVAQTPAAQKDLIKINIGGPSAGYFMTYVAYDHGIYQKHGLDPNIHWFTSGAPLLAALKSGSIDQIVTGLAYVFALGQNIPAQDHLVGNRQRAGLRPDGYRGERYHQDRPAAQGEEDRGYVRNLLAGRP